MQLKHCNYAAFSHFHGCAVNNLGLVLLSCLMDGTQMGNAQENNIEDAALMLF